MGMDDTLIHLIIHILKILKTFLYLSFAYMFIKFFVFSVFINATDVITNTTGENISTFCESFFDDSNGTQEIIRKDIKYSNSKDSNDFLHNGR